MKPCFSKRKHLALLAASALSEPHHSELRRHLEHCPGCRDYARQLQLVGEECATCLKDSPEVEAPQGLHQRVTSRLHALENETASSQRGSLEFLGNWKLAALALILSLAAGSTIIFKSNSPNNPSSSDVTRAAVPSPDAPLPSPSLIHYHLAANQSGDAFERLLTRESLAPTRPDIEPRLSVRSLRNVDF